MEVMNMVAAKQLLDGFTARLTMMQASLTSFRQVDLEEIDMDRLDWPSLSAKREEAKKIFREALGTSLVVNVEMQSQARKLVTKPDELAELLQSNWTLLDAARENLALRNELDREEREKSVPEVDLVAEAIERFKRGLDED